MGLPVLILGESGTGKSASMRNFDAGDLKVINVANKPLPFKNKFESVSTDNYQKIVAELKLNKKPITVIDDAQYLMANEFMRRATERGFDKFTEIAQNFWQLVNIVKELPVDHVVYFLAHIERDANGNEKIKTIGKLLDEKITVEGMFTIVLKTLVNDGQYAFATQNNGHDTVKSPIGMFPATVIDNDLKYVDEKIRNYYELGEFLTDQEMAEIDEAVKKDDVPFTGGEKKKRGARRGSKAEEKEQAEAPAEKEETEAAGEADGETAEEQPKRRRRGLKAEQLEAVVQSDLPKDDSVNEERELDEAPEIELPKRKRRGAKAEQMNPPEESAEEQEEAAAPRRRRRRA